MPRPPSAPLATAARRAATPPLAGLLLLAAGACGDATGPFLRVRTYEVAPAKVPCVGLFPTECLQVRTPPDTAWQLFYDSIDGFTYEAGYRYVLRVAERRIPNPPADGSSIAYRLVAVTSKTRAEP